MKNRSNRALRKRSFLPSRHPSLTPRAYTCPRPPTSWNRCALRPINHAVAQLSSSSSRRGGRIAGGHNLEGNAMAVCFVRVSSLRCRTMAATHQPHQLRSRDDSRWRGVEVTRFIRLTPGRVRTWMGNYLRADKPSRYVTSRLNQLSLPSLRSE